MSAFARVNKCLLYSALGVNTGTQVLMELQHTGVMWCFHIYMSWCDNGNMAAGDIRNHDWVTILLIVSSFCQISSHFVVSLRARLINTWWVLHHSFIQNLSICLKVCALWLLISSSFHISDKFVCSACDTKWWIPFMVSSLQRLSICSFLTNYDHISWTEALGRQCTSLN